MSRCQATIADVVIVLVLFVGPLVYLTVWALIKA